MTPDGVRTGAGGGLLHPLPLLGTTALVVNDHWLKSAFANDVTGKLSDVAGLLFFPLLLVALVEIGQAVPHRFQAPSQRVLLGAVLSTAGAFALVQSTGVGIEVYRLTLGALQHPALALDFAVRAEPLGAWPRVAATADLTDLLAIVGLAVPPVIGRARIRSINRPPRTSPDAEGIPRVLACIEVG